MTIKIEENILERIIDKLSLINSLVSDAQRQTSHLGYIEHYGEIRLKVSEIRRLLKGAK